MSLKTGCQRNTLFEKHILNTKFSLNKFEAKSQIFVAVPLTARCKSRFQDGAALSAPPPPPPPPSLPAANLCQWRCFWPKPLKTYQGIVILSRVKLILVVFWILCWTKFIISIIVIIVIIIIIIINI